MSKFDELFKLWQEYYDMRVPGLPDAMKPTFHYIMGGLIDVNYYYSGVARLPRIHLLTVAPSRAFKSTVMSMCDKILSGSDDGSNFGKLVANTVSLTPQALTGSSDRQGQ